MHTQNVNVVTFTANDGRQLTGDLYSGPDPKIGVLISAGTGFPRRFYRHVAAWLAERGAIVLTYDYRGIGDSGAENLQKSEIDYPDWGKLDLAAAIDALEAQATDLPLVHLAHSVGGHFLGLAENQHKLHRHAFVSVGTGYFGGHHLRNLPLEFYFWWVFGGYCLARYGYIKPVGGWKGEALPPRVFKTWRRWAHKPDYFASEIGSVLTPDNFDEVTSQIRSWIFSDDPIATKKSSASLLSCYPNADSEIVFKHPTEYGLSRIGHEGAFRKGNETLWGDIWEYLLK